MGQDAKNKQAEVSEKMFEATEAQLLKYNEEQSVQREILSLKILTLI